MVYIYLVYQKSESKPKTKFPPIHQTQQPLDDEPAKSNALQKSRSDKSLKRTSSVSKSITKSTDTIEIPPLQRSASTILRRSKTEVEFKLKEKPSKPKLERKPKPTDIEEETKEKPKSKAPKKPKPRTGQQIEIEESEEDSDDADDDDDEDDYDDEGEGGNDGEGKLSRSSSKNSLAQSGTSQTSDSSPRAGSGSGLKSALRHSGDKSKLPSIGSATKKTTSFKLDDEPVCFS